MNVTNKKLLSLTIAAFMVHSATVLKAENNTALSACAEAMVTALSNDQSDKLNYRLTKDSKGIEGKVRGSEVIYLDAKDSDNDKVIARFNCFINEDEMVEKLVAVPTSAPDAKFRARGFE